MEETYRYNVALLVDDNTTDNFIHRRILEITRFARKVIVTRSATEALSYLAECREGSGGVPDIIFLDFFMPGMDGSAFIERFSVLPSYIRNCSNIILLSVLDESLGGHSYNHNHVASFISKPLTDEKLESLTIVPGVSVRKTIL